MEILRKYQDEIEYNISPNSLDVSYPNTSLMKFNNQEFKDTIVSNYFKHYELLKQNTSERLAIMLIKTHALWYLKYIPNSKETKKRIVNITSENELYDELDSLMKNM